MNCPYCSKVMQAGLIRFDGRSLMRWIPQDASRSRSQTFWDALGGVGELTAAQCNPFSHGKLPGHFCPSCKKLIIDTDVTK